MSDVDAPDDFDKEAEREKLREKYGDDEEDREATQRMSELLLQGATMTNKHCDTCGDPIFRQNGTEFCPTCNAAENGSTGTTPEADERAPGEPGQDAGTEPREHPPNQATEASPRQGSDPTARPEPSGARSADTRPEGEATSDRATTSQTGDQRAEADLGAGREALVRALNRHATAGANADDPRRARDHLAAAREAAEALAALR